MIPPRIDTSRVKSPITSRLGDNLAITLEIKGIPAPKIRWFLGNQELGPNQTNFRIRQRRNFYIIQIGFVTEILNNGIAVHASNNFGEDFVRIDIKVYKILKSKTSNRIRSKSQTPPPSENTLTEPRKQLTLVRSGKSKSLPRDTSFTRVQYREQRKQPNKNRVIRHSKSFDDILSSSYEPLITIGRNNSIRDELYYSTDSGYPSPASPRKRLLYHSTEDFYKELKSPEIPTLSCEKLAFSAVSVPPSPFIKRRSRAISSDSYLNKSDCEFQTRKSTDKFNDVRNGKLNSDIQVSKKHSQNTTGSHESRSRSRRKKDKPKPINSELKPFNIVVDIPLDNNNCVGKSTQNIETNIQESEQDTPYICDKNRFSEEINTLLKPQEFSSNNLKSDCSHALVEPLKECIDQSTKVYKVHVIDAKLNTISQVKNRNSNLNKCSAVASVTLNTYNISEKCNSLSDLKSFIGNNEDNKVHKIKVLSNSIGTCEKSSSTSLNSSDACIHANCIFNQENLNTVNSCGQDRQNLLVDTMDEDNPRHSYQSTSSERSNVTDNANLLVSAEVHNPEPVSSSSASKKKKIIKKDKKRDIIEQNNAIVQQVSVVITETTDSGAKYSHYSAHPPAMLGTTSVVSRSGTIPITCSTTNSPGYNTNPGVNSYPQLSTFVGNNNNNVLKSESSFSPMDTSKTDNNGYIGVQSVNSDLTVTSDNITVNSGKPKVKKKKRSRSKSSERKSGQDLLVEDSVLQISNGLDSVTHSVSEHVVSPNDTMQSNNQQSFVGSDSSYMQIVSSSLVDNYEVDVTQDKKTPKKVKKKKRSKSQDNILDEGSDMLLQRSLPFMDNSGALKDSSDRSRAKSVDSKDNEDELMTPKSSKKKKSSKSAKDTSKSLPSLLQDNDNIASSVQETDIDAVFNDTLSSPPKRLTPRQVKRKNKSKTTEKEVPEKADENDVSKSMPSLLQETDLDAVFLALKASKSNECVDVSDNKESTKTKKVKKKKKSKGDDLLCKSMPLLSTEEANLNSSLSSSVKIEGGDIRVDTTFDEYIIDGLSPQKGKKKKKSKNLDEKNENTSSIVQETNIDEEIAEPELNQPEKVKVKRKKKKDKNHFHESAHASQIEPMEHDDLANVESDFKTIFSSGAYIPESGSFMVENVPMPNENVTDSVPSTTEQTIETIPTSDEPKIEISTHDQLSEGAIQINDHMINPLTISPTSKQVKKRKNSSEKKKLKSKSTPCLTEDQETDNLASVPKKKKKKKFASETENKSFDEIDRMEISENIDHNENIHNNHENFPLYRPKVFDIVKSTLPDSVPPSEVHVLSQVDYQIYETNIDDDVTSPVFSDPKENQNSSDKENSNVNSFAVDEQINEFPRNNEVLSTKEEISQENKPKKVKKHRSSSSERKKKAKLASQSLPSLMNEKPLSVMNTTDSKLECNTDVSSFEISNINNMEITEIPSHIVIESQESPKKIKKVKKKRGDVKSDSDLLDSVESSPVTKVKSKKKKSKSASDVIDSENKPQTVTESSVFIETQDLPQKDEVFDPFLSMKPTNDESACEKPKSRKGSKKIKSKSTTYLFEDIIPKPIMTPGKYENFGSKEPPIDTSTPLKPNDETPVSNPEVKIKKKKKKQLSASVDQNLETLGTPESKADSILSVVPTKVKRKKKKCLSSGDILNDVNESNSLQIQKEIVLVQSDKVNGIELVTETPSGKLKKRKKKSADIVVDKVEGIVLDTEIPSEKVKKRKKKSTDIMEDTDEKDNVMCAKKVKKIKKKKSTSGENSNQETEARLISESIDVPLQSQDGTVIETPKKKKKKKDPGHDENEVKDTTLKVKKKKKKISESATAVTTEVMGKVQELSSDPFGVEDIHTIIGTNTEARFDDNFMDTCILDSDTHVSETERKLIEPKVNEVHLEDDKMEIENQLSELDVNDKAQLSVQQQWQSETNNGIKDNEININYDVPSSQKVEPSVHEVYNKFSDDMVPTITEPVNSKDNAEAIQSIPKSAILIKKTLDITNFQTDICETHIVQDESHYPQIVEIESAKSSFSEDKSPAILTTDIDVSLPKVEETIVELKESEEKSETELTKKKTKKKKESSKKKLTTSNDSACQDEVFKDSQEVILSSDIAPYEAPKFVEISTPDFIEDIPEKPQKTRKIKTKKKASKSMENILKDGNRSFGETYLVNQTIDVINSDVHSFGYSSTETSPAKSIQMVERTDQGKDDSKKVKKKKKVKSKENIIEVDNVPKNASDIQNAVICETAKPTLRKEIMTPRKVKKKSKQKKLEQMNNNIEDNVSVVSHNSEEDNGDIWRPRSEMERSFAASEVSFNTAVSSIPDVEAMEDELLPTEDIHNVDKVTKEVEIPAENKDIVDTGTKKVKKTKKKKSKDKVTKEIVERVTVLTAREADVTVPADIEKRPEESDSVKIETVIDHQIPEQDTEEKVWEFLGYKLGDVCKSMIKGFENGILGEDKQKDEVEKENDKKKEIVVTEINKLEVDQNHSIKTTSSESEEQYAEIKSIVSEDFLDKSQRDEDVLSSEGEGELNKSVELLNSSELLDDYERENRTTSQVDLPSKYTSREAVQRNKSKSSYDLRHKPLFGAESREDILSDNTKLTRNKSIDILCLDDTDDIPFLDSSSESQSGVLKSEKTPVFTNADIRKRQLFGIGRIKITGKPFGSSFKTIGLTSSSVKPYKSMSSLLSPDRFQPKTLFSSPKSTPQKGKSLPKPTLLKSFKKENKSPTKTSMDGDVKSKSITVETITTTKVTEETTDMILSPKRKEMLGKTAVQLMQKSSLDDDKLYKEPETDSMPDENEEKISEMEIYETEESITFTLPKESQVFHTEQDNNISSQPTSRYTSLMKPVSGIDKTIKDLYELEHYIEGIIDNAMHAYKQEVTMQRDFRQKTVSPAEKATAKVIKEIETSVIDILNKSDMKSPRSPKHVSQQGNQFTSVAYSFGTDLEEEFYVKEDLSPTNLAKLDTTQLLDSSSKVSETQFQMRNKQDQDDRMGEKKGQMKNGEDKDFSGDEQDYSDSDSGEDSGFLIQGISVMDDKDISAIFGKRFQKLDSLSKGIDKSLEDIHDSDDSEEEYTIAKESIESTGTQKHENQSNELSQKSELQELENRIMKLEKKLVSPFPSDNDTNQKDSEKLVSPYSSDSEVTGKYHIDTQQKEVIDTHEEINNSERQNLVEATFSSSVFESGDNIVTKNAEEKSVTDSLVKSDSPIDSPREIPRKHSGSHDDSIIPVVTEDRGRSGTFDSEDTGASDTTSTASFDTVLHINDLEVSSGDELDVTQENTPTRIEEDKTPTPIEAYSSSENEFMDEKSPNDVEVSFKKTYKLNRKISQDFEGSFEDLVQLNEDDNNKEANEEDVFQNVHDVHVNDVVERQRSISEMLSFNFEPTSYLKETVYEPSTIYLQTVSTSDEPSLIGNDKLYENSKSFDMTLLPKSPRDDVEKKKQTVVEKTCTLVTDLDKVQDENSDLIETTGIVEPSWDSSLSFNKSLSEQCEGSLDDLVHINYESAIEKPEYIPLESDKSITQHSSELIAAPSNTDVNSSFSSHNSIQSPRSVVKDSQQFGQTDSQTVTEISGKCDNKTDKNLTEIDSKDNNVITISGDGSDNSDQDEKDSDASSDEDNEKTGGYNISAISDSDKDSDDSDEDDDEEDKGSGELSDSTDSTDSSVEVEACISEGLKYRYYHENFDDDDEEEEDDSDEEEMRQAMMVFRSMHSDRELHTIPEDPEIDLEYGSDEEEEHVNNTKQYSSDEFEDDSDEEETESDSESETESKRAETSAEKVEHSVEKPENSADNDDYDDSFDEESESEDESDDDDDDQNDDDDAGNKVVNEAQDEMSFTENSELTTDISIQEYTEEDLVVRRRHIERRELYTARTTVEETKPTSTISHPDYSFPSPKKNRPENSKSQAPTTAYNIPVDRLQSVPTKNNVSKASSVSNSNNRPQSPLGASAPPLGASAQIAPRPMEQRSGDVADTLFIEKALMESFFTNIGSIVFLIFAIVVFHLMDQWLVKENF